MRPTQITKQQALALLQEGRLAEAKTVLEQISSREPRDWEVWNLRAAAHGMLGEYSHCEACCREAVRLQPGAIGIYNNLANALKFQGKLEEAESGYREALRLMPAYAEAHNNLGNLLREQGRIEEAESSYREALRHQPNYPDALNNLGNCLKDQGRHKEGEECYRRSLQLNPNHADARVNLGIALQHQGKLDDAASCYESALRINPQHADGLFYLGFIRQEQKETDAARKLYRQVLRVRPDHASAQYFLAALGEADAPLKSPLDYVKTLFDYYADRFDQHLVESLGYKAPRIIADAVQAVMGADATLDVIDLGCGTGLCGLELRGISRRLIGVDLSPKMIDKARSRGVYDEFIVSDVDAALRSHESDLDLVVAGDVFIYIGDLAGVFARSHAALKSGGLLAFSIEVIDDGADFVLRETGRYAQSRRYIRGLAKASGFEEISMQEIVLRHQKDEPVAGCIFILRKYGSA